MKIEHIAYLAENPKAVKDWYISNLNFSLVREKGDVNDTFFLGDESGNVMVEIYKNPTIPVPDYAEMHPLILHLAFVSTDPTIDSERLKKAGATMVGEIETTPNGDRLAMMRDPWGFAIQLCNRAEPMI